jgi:ureidoglycolate hydrolase
MTPASSLAIGRALALAPRPRGARTDRRARGALPRGASRRRPPLGAQPRSRAAGHAPPRAAASRVALTAEDLTPETFAPFGQVVRAEEDGVAFGPDDAALDLSQGTPRFYIMRLRDKTMSFDRITFHARVTQCLGALGDAPWFMAVARPTMDVAAYPTREDIRVFRVPPGVFVKMHAGTWHAGPLWDAARGPAHIDFYNLELSDTNQVDHNTHDYDEAEGLVFDVHVEG